MVRFLSGDAGGNGPDADGLTPPEIFFEARVSGLQSRGGPLRWSLASALLETIGSRRAGAQKIQSTRGKNTTGAHPGRGLSWGSTSSAGGSAGGQLGGQLGAHLGVSWGSTRRPAHQVAERVAACLEVICGQHEAVTPADPGPARGIRRARGAPRRPRDPRGSRTESPPGSRGATARAGLGQRVQRVTVQGDRRGRRPGSGRHAEEHRVVQEGVRGGGGVRVVTSSPDAPGVHVHGDHLHDLARREGNPAGRPDGVTRRAPSLDAQRGVASGQTVVEHGATAQGVHEVDGLAQLGARASRPGLRGPSWIAENRTRTPSLMVSMFVSRFVPSRCEAHLRGTSG